MVLNLPRVAVLKTGRLGYRQALKLQNLLIERHKTDRSSNVLILTEHNPVYTIGIRTETYKDDEIERLQEIGAEFIKTNRGGLITFHGPGQMVCYPILNLKQFPCSSLKQYVCFLEKTIMGLCKEFKVTTETNQDTGIWVGNNKICAIGIHASSFITSHGLALNCNTDLKWFSYITPCGLVGKGVTSLSKELGRKIEIPEVIPNFLSNFQSTFNCQPVPMDDVERDRLLLECCK